MIHRHPLDPPKQHDAAERLGVMVADGVISEEEAAKTMGTIVRVAADNAPDVDRAGLRMRLVWSAADAKVDRQRQRANAATAIRWAIRPLIRDKATKEAIEAAARKASGGAFEWPEVVAILKEEWHAAHGRRRK